MPERTSAYSRVATFYETFLAITGFKRGVERFLDRLPFHFPPRAKLLDAGCGTGLMARYLARRFPEAQVIAFDIDPGMLRAMRRELGRSPHLANLEIAIGDLRTPAKLRHFTRPSPLVIKPGSLDGVFVSGALEHVPLAETIGRLADLLKPGGIFLNLGVRRNPAGAVLGMVYRFRPYTTAEMRRACLEAGLTDVEILRLEAEDFPANLSRIAIMARKRA